MSDHDTFRALFDGGRRVEIPTIQRDYAQGRDDEHSQEVRRRFVGSLVKALKSPDAAPLDLDFVYGRESDGRLEPLDGQQRLTTLFLLHWYVANLDGVSEDFRSWISPHGRGSGFTYNTRPSAREFFDELVKATVPVRALSRGASAVSLAIKDAPWFAQQWRRDPTVIGCLAMLDCIHEHLADESGLWLRLVSTDAPPVVFNLLRLENFGLSDDLYLKMNARGKALTPFEIFKAEFESRVGTVFGDRADAPGGADWRQYVSQQFDLAWTDLLWRTRGEAKEIDPRFMRLLRALALVGSVDAGDDDRLPGRVSRLLGAREPSVAFLTELGLLEAPIVERLVRRMDALASPPNAPSMVGASSYFDEVKLFERVLLALSSWEKDGLTQADWIGFYAWSLLLLRRDAATVGHDWLRLIWNLTVNSDVRDDSLVPMLRGVRELSAWIGPELLTRVASEGLDRASGFNKEQREEERAKARLLLRAPEWRALIERAERHPYFRGDIGFLLRFSGVLDALKAGGWSDSDDAAHRARFADWYERATSVFPEGDSPSIKMFPEHLWERALLAEGDYLLQRGRGWSFLDLKDRDATWRRLLRADTSLPDREARRDVVRRVLERINPANVESSLRAIIAAGVRGADDRPVSGFRGLLVRDPGLIDYCDYRIIRLEDDSAFLLRTTQRNGYHVDLYVYDLYRRLRAQLADVAPFDDVNLREMLGKQEPSRVTLTAPTAALTVEKHGADMVLSLQSSSPDEQLAASLSGWQTTDNVTFTRRVAPALAEQTILQTASALRSLANH